MEEIIEILTLALPLTAVTATGTWFLFFLCNRNQDREDIKKFIKSFVIFALASGLTGFIIGTIGNRNIPYDDGVRAFNKFCSNVGLIMSIINTTAIVEKILFKRLKKHLLEKAKEEYNLK